MARCELSGKGPVVKNLVSHSNIKTKSRAFINVQKKQLFSSSLKHSFTLKVATGTLRTLEHQGGLDLFLIHQNNDLLSKKALKIKAQVLKVIHNKRSKKKKGASIAKKA